MRLVTSVLLLAIALPLCADAVEEVRQAEIGFAKAFADRDKAKFFSYVADDAVFVSALRTLRGKPEVIASWSRFFDGVPEAPFSWGPERVEITNGGQTGFSMGPIFGPDGKHGGYYSSIWQKQKDGSWKVVVDGPGSPGAPLAETAAPFAEGYVDASDGAKLYYRKIGRGPVTLIVPLDHVFFDDFKQFADIATVITYDPRNRGKSNRVDVKTMSIEQDVRDLEAVRTQLDVKTFVPVGYSYLGKMVVMYASAYPDRVARVVQFGPAGNVPDTNPPQATEAELGVPAETLQRAAAIGPSASPQEICEARWNVMRYRFVGSPKNATRLASPCGFENERAEQFFASFAVLWPTIQKPMSTENLAKVTMPVLTIHGTRDRNSPFASGQDWARILPNARLVRVDGAAHAVWADDPVMVFGDLRHFLRGEWPLGSMKMR
jgi:pimeloyl-ACP methyl ester carboxylesterase/ketosteroid isomerase-like protein